MKKQVLLAAMAAPAALAGEQLDSDAASFQASSVAHTGIVRVAAAPEHAFQLFTAPGEKLWIDDWDPLVLNGGDGRRRGAVFTTGDGPDRTYWVVVDYDPEALHARYARIAPGTRAGTVEVVARPDGSGSAQVQVSYELTALTEEGNRMLAAFGEREYVALMLEWERIIRDANFEFPVLSGEAG